MDLRVKKSFGRVDVAHARDRFGIEEPPFDRGSSRAKRLLQYGAVEEIRERIGAEIFEFFDCGKFVFVDHEQEAEHAGIDIVQDKPIGKKQTRMRRSRRWICCGKVQPLAAHAEMREQTVITICLEQQTFCSAFHGENRAIRESFGKRRGGRFSAQHAGLVRLRANDDSSFQPPTEFAGVKFNFR